MIPCWKSDQKFELISGTSAENESFQLIDLDYKKGASFIKQTVDLYEGKF